VGFCKGEKVKFTLELAMKAKRVEERYSSTVSVSSALDGVGGQPHTPSALHPGKKHGYQFYRRLCERRGPVWMDMDGSGFHTVRGSSSLALQIYLLGF